MTPLIPGPLDADEILRVDRQTREIEALLDTERPLPISDRQRVSANHPAHVSGPETIMVTGSLGCLHAWFFHGCRWDEGWTGFGNRIHRADFRRLARLHLGGKSGGGIENQECPHFPCKLLIRLRIGAKCPVRARDLDGPIPAPWVGIQRKGQ